MVAEGVQVCAISRNEKALSKLTEHSDGIIPLALDIGSTDAAGRVLNALGSCIDIVVNNAGLLLQGQFGEQTLTNIEKMYRTNVFAPAMLTQGLIPALKRSESAHILNIGSMGGFQGSAKFPGLWAYSSSTRPIWNWRS